MPSPIRKIVRRSPKVSLVFAVTTTVVLLAISSVIIYQSRAPQVTTINYSQLYQIAEAGTAASVSIQSDTLTVQSQQEQRSRRRSPATRSVRASSSSFRKQNIPVEFRPVEATWSGTLLTWGAPILTVLLLGVIGWRVYASTHGGVGSFHSRIKTENRAFALLTWPGLMKPLQNFRRPSTFCVTRTVLVVWAAGPRAAFCFLDRREQAKLCWRVLRPVKPACPFLLASGSSFQEKFAGVGASRVRRLFAEGRSSHPALSSSMRSTHWADSVAAATIPLRPTRIKLLTSY
jgi:cell division protease FtsH